MRLAYLVGARPNLVKMAPVVGEARRRLDGSHVLIHTGQHYDSVMSDVFFEELGVPEPDHVLGVGSGTHAVQTARAMERLEPVLIDERPDLLIVPGDVNSTLAGALVAAKLGIPFAHLEAGLRSFDRSMPEEVNRIVADEFADLLFVTCEDAIGNLAAEGIDNGRIHFVGNTMIDTLVALRPRIAESKAAERLGVAAGDYVLVTLHRPALVDGPLLGEAVAELGKLAQTLPVVLPAHPRTAKRLATLDLPAGIVVTEPLGYLDFLSLEASAGAVLTDSGGVQEETTFLGVPCFTLRDNTERPVTITAGTNTLLGLAPRRISDVAALLSEKVAGPAAPPPLWDGRAAERVVDVLAATLRQA
ncbi:MAG TPA: UDP-N-acetylglucosamine 2-epimerase (non-hydrolyzing) [Gaiellaceae bacterium]|nr:UDP-N-acetylglucosamine 2-epimerase (non-hydrolyzing) [Gaiellaceae bacterium]